MIGHVDPNSGSFLALVNLSAGDEAYKKVRDIMNMMGLPDAEDGAYFMGPNGLRIYVRRLGVSFSVPHKPEIRDIWSKFHLTAIPDPVFEARRAVDERILQPLFRQDVTPNCAVEIVPGIPRAKIPESRLKEIKAEFKARSINFYFRRVEFIGRLPLQCDASENDAEQWVVTNRRALKLKSDYDFNLNRDAGLQEKIFYPYTSMLGEAFGSANGMRVQKALRELQADAALPDHDPNKKLFAYWHASNGISSDRHQLIVKSSQSYERQLPSL